MKYVYNINQNHLHNILDELKFYKSQYNFKWTGIDSVWTERKKERKIENTLHIYRSTKHELVAVWHTF